MTEISSLPGMPDYRSYSWQKSSKVYFIGAISGPVKIGVAVNPARRLQQVQVGHPRKLALIAEIPGDFEQERFLHDYFKPERLHGEWFRRSERLAQYLLDLIEPVD